MSKLPIFICYRQSDGKAVANRVNDLLHGQAVTLVDPASGATASYELDAYFDQTSAAVGDFTDIHGPYLKRARVFIVVCTPGAKLKESSEDWVHQEIDWWLENSQSAPLLIDALGEEARYVPDEVAKRWPYAQRIRLVDGDWAKLSPEELAIEEDRVRERLIGGITGKTGDYLVRELQEKELQARTLQTALDRQTTLSRLFRVAFVIATLFLILAAYTAWFGFVEKAKTEKALDRERVATTNAENAKDKTRTALNTANEQRKRAEEQRDRADAQADRNKSLLLSQQAHDLVGVNDQRALLLAVEAVNATAKHDYVTPEARAALQIAIERVTGIGLPGHTDSVDVASFSADERYLATGSTDPSVAQRNEVRIWDVSDPTEAELTHILKSTGKLQSIHFDRAAAHVLTVQRKRIPQSVLANPPTEVLVWPLAKDRRYPVARQLLNEPTEVAAITESWEADLLAVADGAGQISIFSFADLSKPTIVREFQPAQSGRISRLIFSRDDKLLLGCTDRSSVLIWDLESASAQPATEISADLQADRPVSPEVNVDICGISEDRSLLFAGSSDWFDRSTWADLDLKIWRLDELAPVGEPVLLSHRGSPNSSAIQMASFGHEEKTLVSTSLDGWVRAWELTKINGQLTAKKSGEHKLEGLVHEVTASPDRLLLAVDAGNKVQLLRFADLKSLESKVTLRSLPGFDASIQSLRFSPTGRLLFAGSLGGGARLWNLQQGDPASGGSSLALSPYKPALRLHVLNEGRAAIALRSSAVEFWDISNPFAPNALRVWPISQSLKESFLDSLFSRVVLSPDLAWAAVQSDKENETDIIELRKSGRNFKVQSRMWKSTNEIEFSPNGHWLFVEEGETQTAYDLRVGSPGLPKPAAFPLPDGSYSREASQFGPFVLHRRYVNEYQDRVGRSEQVGTIWELHQEGGPVAKLEIDGFARGIGDSAFSPNGRGFALAGKSVFQQRESDDTVVRLFQLNQSEIRTFNLEGHEFTPNISFSGDGRWLLAASNDILLGWRTSHARLWRMDYGTEQPQAFVLSGVDSFLHSRAFSPDGRYLVTINGGGPTARLWRLDSAEPELAGILNIPRQTHNWHWDIKFDLKSTVVVIANTDNSTPYLWRLDQPTIPARGIPIRNGDRGVKSIQFVDDDQKLLIRNSGGTYDGLSGTAGAHVTIVNLDTFPDLGSTFSSLETSESLSALIYHPEVGLLYSDGKSLNTQGIEVGVTVARAKRALGRNLTLEEWDKIGLGELYSPTFADLNVDRRTLRSLIGVVKQLRTDDSAAAELSEKIVKWAVAQNEAVACNSIAWEFALNGDGASALEVINCALNHFPEETNYRDTRGVALALLGRTDEAIDDFRFAVKRERADPTRADFISNRKKWIAELQAGRNPFSDGIE